MPVGKLAHAVCPVCNGSPAYWITNAKSNRTSKDCSCATRLEGSFFFWFHV
jgi:hypothetical protein